MKKVWVLVLMGFAVLTLTAQQLPSQKEYMETKSVAEKGDVDAQFQMGQYCFLAEKYTEAFNWYFKAAQQGFSEAQHNVGYMYFSGCGTAKSRCISALREIIKDLEEK